MARMFAGAAEVPEAVRALRLTVAGAAEAVRVPAAVTVVRAEAVTRPPAEAVTAAAEPMVRLVARSVEVAAVDVTLTVSETRARVSKVASPALLTVRVLPGA